jgi:M6 family metalloprotease-like protein
MRLNYRQRAVRIVPLIFAVLFLEGPSCNWQNYPHLWPTPTDFPFLVIKCQFPDAPNIPAGLDDSINRFLTIAGITTGNMLDYYSDVSYGAILLGPNKIVGWLPSGYTTTQLGGANNRNLRVEACANSLPSSDVADIAAGAYWGIIIVTNQQNDGGACYDGQQPLQIQGNSYNLACVVFDPDSLFPAFAAHEIGHGLGMPHSYDNTQNPCGGAPGEYCDKWDIMSALNTYQFDYNWVTPPPIVKDGAGPGMNAPNLLHMGWIPASQIATYNIGDPPTSFAVSALSHPVAPLGVQPLVVQIPILVGSILVGNFTVEYRQRDGWDAGIPISAVLVHLYKAGLSPYSFLVETPTDLGAVLPGQTLSEGEFSVTVNSTDPASGTAVVTIGP